MSNFINELYKSKESEILGLEYEVLESCVNNKSLLDMDLKEMCMIYDNGSLENINEYREYQEIINKKLNSFYSI